MKALLLFASTFLVYSTGFVTSTKAEKLTVEKQIQVSPKDNIKQKVDLLVEMFLNTTDGQIKYNYCADEKITLEGKLPLVLEQSPFVLSSQFNGEVSYQLEITYSESEINLQFQDLYHHSKHSINGWDFDYGVLHSDFKTNKHPVRENYNELSEDYSRIHRVKTDDQMARLVCNKTIETIECALSSAL